MDSAKGKKMNDSISRQAAMAYPLSWEHYDMEHGDRKFICGVESYREYIEHLPSVDEWIPCSERLPEIEKSGQRRGYYLTTNGYGSVCLTRYEFYRDFLKTGWQSDIQITAWMPLPEPYKVGTV